LFWLLQYIPATSEKAKALALVSLHKMLLALESAVKQLPENQCRIIEIEEIRRLKE
jgi:hypothetical protein